MAAGPWQVLVVDDHLVVPDGLIAVLQRLLPSAHFDEAGAVPQALDKIAARRPHMVLLDVDLPCMNGLDLAAEIEAVYRLIRLLMVVAEVDPWTVQKALALGASGFVAKARSGCLADAVLAMLTGSQVLCEDSQAALERAE